MAGWHHWLDGCESEWTLGSWWWTGRPGVLQFMGLQRVGYDWATELNWTCICPFLHLAYETFSLTMSSKFSHVVVNSRILFLCKAEQFSTLSTYHILLIHSSVDSQLGCFHFLFWFSVKAPIFHYFGYILRSETDRLCGNSMFNFLENWHTISPEVVPFCIPTNNAQHFQFLHTPKKADFKASNCQHLSLFVWLELFFIYITVILMGMKWYLSVVLISTSLMIHDVQYLLMCLPVTCIFIWGNTYSSPFACFKKLLLWYNWHITLYKCNVYMCWFDIFRYWNTITTIGLALSHHLVFCSRNYFNWFFVVVIKS